MKVKNYIVTLNKDYLPMLCENGSFTIDGRKRFNNPADIFEFFSSMGFKDAAAEHVYMACLDIKGRLIGCALVSSGSFNASFFPVRDILQKALLLNAASIAICHNHPSGDIMPSPEDRSATKQLKNACDVIGIKLADHLIIGAHQGHYYSFFSEGAL